MRHLGTLLGLCTSDRGHAAWYTSRFVDALTVSTVSRGLAQVAEPPSGCATLCWPTSLRLQETPRHKETQAPVLAPTALCECKGDRPPTGSKGRSGWALATLVQLKHDAVASFRRRHCITRPMLFLLHAVCSSDTVVSELWVAISETIRVSLCDSHEEDTVTQLSNRSALVLCLA